MDYFTNQAVQILKHSTGDGNGVSTPGRTSNRTQFELSYSLAMTPLLVSFLTTRA